MKSYLKGFQHIGLPTSCVKDTVDFYKELGFELIYETKLGEVDVAFLDLNGFVVETYTYDNPVMKAGAIDHITIDVSDVDECYKIAKDRGYKITEGGDLQGLPFFNGVRFFKIEGVNNEIIEFCQKL